MKQAALIFLSIWVGPTGLAQHTHAEQAIPAAVNQSLVGDSTRKGTSMEMPHDGQSHKAMPKGMSHGAMPGMNHTMPDGEMGRMTHSFSRNLPMNRNGSGTSWHPDATPLYAYMKHSPKWQYMLHYSVFLRHTNQNFNNTDKRGRGAQFDAPNWAMGMAQRQVGQRGLLLVRAMLSLDRFTVGNGGYPLLFQSGETYKGQRLVDRQHPHDLFSELSVGYTQSINANTDAYVYVGYPGEPALGPPAFMHRISSFNNPDAPLSHHWMDATHITFGVATAGFRYKIAKVEVSSFTGREPDEHRLNFDKPRFDSYSYRLSVNPTPELALQFSQGYLKSPEAADPGENVTRTTASLLHSKLLGGRPDRYVTSALIWGLNRHDGQNENAYLAETSLQLGRTALYGRYENITKSVQELALVSETDPGFGGAFQPGTTVNINNLTLGVNYRLAQRVRTDLVIGAQLTGSKPDKLLEPVYGKLPLSGELYLRITPSVLVMQTLPGMNRKGMNR